MDRQEIAKKIIPLIAQQLSIKPEQIKESDTMASLGADSLDRVEIVMNIEEAFSIDINDAEEEKLQTVGQAIDYIHSLCEKK